MLIVCLICFAVAAVLGVTLAAMYRKGKLSLNVAIAHGLFAATGLILLIVAVVQKSVPSTATIAMVIFIIAALGGATLLYNHLTKHKLPKPLIAIHGSAAVIAFLLLLFGAIR